MEDLKKIKYSEIFYSFQGEGRFVGVPSVFLRTFGCNFECPGFGQPRNALLPKEAMPHNLYPLNNINRIEDLPIFDIGCDSSASWSRRYKHLVNSGTVEDISNSIVNSIPTARPTPHNKPHLVFTGGEPLLGWQRLYPDLLEQKNIINNFEQITFETNGTQIIRGPLRDYWLSWYKKDPLYKVTWSVSPKLNISGEKFEDSIKPEVLLSMNDVSYSYLYLKFVVRDIVCLNEVEKAVNEYKKAGVKIDQIYLMPEGATQVGLSYTSQQVAEIALRYGYSYSPRLHVNIFGNKWGT